MSQAVTDVFPTSTPAEDDSLSIKDKELGSISSQHLSPTQVVGSLPSEEGAEHSPFVQKIWNLLGTHNPEKQFLLKLDLTLLTAASVGVMIRYLDQVNINNAFNSGMKESLSLYGNELNFANALWSAAYVFGQIPSNLILLRTRAPYWIAFIELGWTICTFCTAAVTNVQALYVVRFFNGLFEAGHFPAVMYIASSYYQPHELAFRNTIIQVFVAVGPLFSGFLMAAVYAGLNDHLGWPGWRWLFIVCGCISLPSCVWTFLAIPQLPSRARPNWIFSARDIAIARERMPSEKKMYTGLYAWKDIKRWHSTWHVWLFPIFFIFSAQLGQAGASMIFWVKGFNRRGQPPVFSVAQINIIPLGINFIQIVLSLSASKISDTWLRGRRWPVMAFSGIAGVIIATSLAATPIYPSNRNTRWLLYYLTPFAGLAAGCTWTAVNEMNRSDPEKRAYISALMNASAYIFTAWVPIFTFPTYKQPYVSPGLYATSGFAFCAFAVALAIGYFDSRDRKLAAASGEHRGSDLPDQEKD